MFTIRTGMTITTGTAASRRRTANLTERHRTYVAYQHQRAAERRAPGVLALAPRARGAARARAPVTTSPLSVSVAHDGLQSLDSSTACQLRSDFDLDATVMKGYRIRVDRLCGRPPQDFSSRDVELTAVTLTGHRRP